MSEAQSTPGGEPSPSTPSASITLSSRDLAFLNSATRETFERFGTGYVGSYDLESCVQGNTQVTAQCVNLCIRDYICSLDPTQSECVLLLQLAHWSHWYVDGYPDCPSTYALAKALFRVYGTELLKVEVILIPVYRNGHFYLIAVFNPFYTAANPGRLPRLVTAFDSLGPQSPCRRLSADTVNFVKQLRALYGLGNMMFDTNFAVVPSQEDGCSCGMYTFCNAQWVLHDYFFENRVIGVRDCERTNWYSQLNGVLARSHFVSVVAAHIRATGREADYVAVDALLKSFKQVIPEALFNAPGAVFVPASEWTADILHKHRGQALQTVGSRRVTRQQDAAARVASIPASAVLAQAVTRARPVTDAPQSPQASFKRW